MITFKIINEDKRVIRAYGIPNVTELDFSDFYKNPLVLWNHNAQNPPVGRVGGFTEEFVEITLAKDDVNPFASIIWDILRSTPSAFTVGIGFIEKTGNQGRAVLEVSLLPAFPPEKD